MDVEELPSIRQVLVDVFQNQELREEATEALESSDPEEFLVPFLGEEPGWVIRCSVTDSMMSGTWGLKCFVLAGKFHLYYRPDFGIGDDIGESLPIVGVWARPEDGKGLSSLLMQAYTSYWKDFALPPAMGQWADGPQVFLTNAIATILENDLDAWSTVLNRLRDDLKEHSSRLQGLAREAAQIVECNESDAVGILKAVLPDSRHPHPVLNFTKFDSRVLVAAFVATIGRGGF